MFSYYTIPHIKYLYLYGFTRDKLDGKISKKSMQNGMDKENTISDGKMNGKTRVYYSLLF